MNQIEGGKAISRRYLRYYVSVLIFFIFAGCGKSNEQIGENVRIEIQGKLNSHYKDYCLLVTDVQVVSKGNGQYAGIARIAHEDTVHDIKVKVTVDGDKFMWEVPPGAFMFLAQYEIRRLLR